MHHCLIIFIFWKFSDCFYLLASLAKAISGRAEIGEWKLDTDMMMCKKSSDAHLFSYDIIDFCGKQCLLFPPICAMLFANYVIVSPILSSSNCQFYRRWTSWKCLTCLVNVLAGAAGQCKRNDSRGVFYQSLKLRDCDLFLYWFRWHTHLKDMDSLRGSVCYGRYKQLKELLTVYHVIYLDAMELIYATVG